MIRRYDELMALDTFEKRFDYLRLSSSVGFPTFGFDRYLNQVLYSSLEWKRIRDIVMIRDKGCDLAIEDYPIVTRVVIHHMNPVSVEDFKFKNLNMLKPEFLITTSIRTHQAIHYGNKELLPKPFRERFPGDTKLW